MMNCIVNIVQGKIGIYANCVSSLNKDIIIIKSGRNSVIRAFMVVLVTCKNEEDIF